MELNETNSTLAVDTEANIAEVATNYEVAPEATPSTCDCIQPAVTAANPGLTTGQKAALIGGGVAFTAGVAVGIYFLFKGIKAKKAAKKAAKAEEEVKPEQEIID